MMKLQRLCVIAIRVIGVASLLVGLASTALARIPKPDDAPRPLSAEESAKRFQLPPCLGICPARSGLIAAYQMRRILFLADRDGDERAEVREVLFEGFAKGPLEQRINCPKSGPD